VIRDGAEPKDDGLRRTRHPLVVVERRGIVDEGDRWTEIGEALREIALLVGAERVDATLGRLRSAGVRAELRDDHDLLPLDLLGPDELPGEALVDPHPG